MPAKYRVRVTRTAERDIESVWSFIAQDSRENAESFIAEVGEDRVTVTLPDGFLDEGGPE